jgi:hypothetical protein
MGHPGTFHFRELIEEVSNGVYEAGGKPAVFAVSDICDGVASRRCHPSTQFRLPTPGARPGQALYPQGRRVSRHRKWTGDADRAGIPGA